jgi:hypothetical protein
MDDQNVDGENKASPEFVEKDLKDKTLQISWIRWIRFLADALAVSTKSAVKAASESLIRRPAIPQSCEASIESPTFQTLKIYSFLKDAVDSVSHFGLLGVWTLAILQ